MSAEIIAFAPRRHRMRERMRLPPAVFRSAPSRDDLTMDHVDSAPCEYVSSHDAPGHDHTNG